MITELGQRPMTVRVAILLQSKVLVKNAKMNMIKSGETFCKLGGKFWLKYVGPNSKVPTRSFIKPNCTSQFVGNVFYIFFCSSKIPNTEQPSHWSRATSHHFHTALALSLSLSLQRLSHGSPNLNFTTPLKFNPTLTLRT